MARAPLFRFRRIFLPLPLLMVAASVLTGCGIGPIADSSSATITLTGKVHGGQQGVSNSTIQLYSAGRAGNGSAATAMLNASVTTDQNGFFTITNLYTPCTHSTDQWYITATNGNPGLTSGTNNQSIALIAALGDCGNLSQSTYIYLNEVTTAAAVWALAPFMTSSVANLGASSTNATGLRNAFLNAKLLANTSNGMAASVASNLTIETGKLYALADALAPCVDSNGSDGNCASLRTAATPVNGPAPANNTLAAALSIVRNPGDANIVPSVYGLINATSAPFPTTLTQAPNDWTMSMTVTGGGVHTPSALRVDAGGNVWVASYDTSAGNLSAFSPQGTPFNSTGYGVYSGTQLLAESYGVTIDNSGNVWVANQQLPHHSPTQGSLVKFSGSTSGTPGVPFYDSATSSYFFYDSSIDFPTGLATDSNGNIMMSNYADSTATIYSSSGAVVSSNLASGNSSFPVIVAPDAAHGLWLADYGNGSVTHVDVNGNVLAYPNCCSGPDGLAIDNTGNAWVSNYYIGTVSEITPMGASVTLPTLVDGGGEGGVDGNYPAGLSIDAAQNIWVADYHGAAFTELAGNSHTLPAGTGISPSYGYGLDANLGYPFTVSPDASGNLWISDFSHSDIVVFFGLATPTLTPQQVVQAAP
jgi:hypothetical protein